MGSHGPHYDEFHAQSGEHHGGALFDEHHGGPAANAGSAKVTQTYRDVTADGSGHGKLWDEFGWKQMPNPHGRHFDSDFTQPAALDGAHGSWQDVFSGGTQVRADVNGIAAVEAVVIECHGDHAVLELRRPRHADGGGRVEVNLNQIRELRHATQQGQASETRKPAASPGNTPAPKAAEQVHTGADGGARTELDTAAATGSVFTAVKTLRELAGVDVAKDAAGERMEPCTDCGRKSSYDPKINGPKPYCASCAHKGSLASTHKSIEDDDGETVSKMAMADFHTHSCSQCKAPYHITSRATVHSIKSATHGGTLIGKAVTQCQGKGCTTQFKNGKGSLARGVFTKATAVGKSIETTLSDLRKTAGLEA